MSNARPNFVLHDRAIRGEALGNFRKLLGAVARSPSMLNYLNNAESRASPANENYARELLELHTLGEPNYLNADYQHWADVPGAKDGLAAGYIDQDVYETAKPSRAGRSAMAPISASKANCRLQARSTTSPPGMTLTRSAFLAGSSRPMPAIVRWRNGAGYAGEPSGHGAFHLLQALPPLAGR